MTRGARYSVVFLFALSLALATGNYLLSASAVRRAEASAASTLQLCQAGNELRRQQVALWDHLLAVAMPPERESAAARARRAEVTRQFAAYVHQVFAPQRCDPGGKP